MAEAQRGNLLIASGSHYSEFVDDIAASIETAVAPVRHRRFSNSELHNKYEESIRGADLFIVQSFAVAEKWSANDALVELMLMNDSALRASAAHITNVCPWFPYARQDQKHTPRVPISAAVAVEALVTSGAERIVSVNLHSGQTQGHLKGPFDHLPAKTIWQPWLAQWITGQDRSEIVFASPDSGRIELAEDCADAAGVDVVLVNKRRSLEDSSIVKAQRIIGDVVGKRCVIIDDMIDTAGTLREAALLLEREGAKSIMAVATHGVFSGEAVKMIEDSPIEEVVVTDTFPNYECRELPWLKRVSIAKLIGQTILEVHNEGSVSKLC